jgi:hypothetical protein
MPEGILQSLSKAKDKLWVGYFVGILWVATYGWHHVPSGTGFTPSLNVFNR